MRHEEFANFYQAGAAIAFVTNKGRLFEYKPNLGENDLSRATQHSKTRFKLTVTLRDLKIEMWIPALFT